MSYMDKYLNNSTNNEDDESYMDKYIKRPKQPIQNTPIKSPVYANKPLPLKKQPAFIPTKSPNFVEGGSLRNETLSDKIYGGLKKTTDTLQLPLTALENSWIVPTMVKKLIDPEQSKIEQENLSKHPVVNFVGEAAGSVSPFGVAGKALNKIPFLANQAKTGLGKLAKTGLKTGLEGLLYGGAKGTAEGITEYAQGKSSISDIGKKALNEGAMFGAGGAILGTAIPALGNLYKNTRGFTKGIEKVGQAIDDYKFPQIRNLQETTKPMLNNRGVELSPFKRDLPKNITPTMKNVNVADDLKPLNNDVNINSPLEVQNSLKSTTVENNGNIGRNGVLIEDIADRGLSSVGNRKIKAYQYENPEFKPWYQDYAKNILDTEFIPAESGWSGDLNRSMQSDVTRKLKESVGSYGDIKKGLEAIVKDNGAENIAAAKRVETVIDDMLSNGYKSVNGEYAPASKPYLDMKNQLTGKSNVASQIIPENQQIPKLETPPIQQQANNVRSESLPETEVFNKLSEAEQKEVETKVRSFLISTSNLESAAKDAKLYPELKQYFDDVINVNGFSPSINDIDTIMIATKKLFKNYKNPFIEDRMNGLEKAKAFLESKGFGKSDLPPNKIIPETQQIPKSTFDYIKTIDDLPNDLPSLESYVKEVQRKKDNGLILLDIDLQLFAEARKRMESLSKVYTNTFEKTDMFTQAEKDILNSSFTNDAKSSVKGELESLANAKKRLNDNYNGEYETLMNKELYSGEDVDTLFGMLENERNIARQTGDYTKVREIASKGVKEAGREGGRTVQAFAKYSRTPEGKIVEAQRVVDNVGDAVRTQNPKIDNAIKADTTATEQLTQSIKKESEKVIDEVVNQVEKAKATNPPLPKLNGQETNFPKMLQDKISKALNPKTPEAQGFIRNMLKDLFGEASEKIKFPPKLPRLDESMNTLSNSYKYSKYAEEIRGKAHDLLKTEFADSPEALKLLDNYFKSGFKPPHSQKLLNDIIKKRLSGFETKAPSVADPNKPSISQWVKNWYGNAGGQQAKADFVESLMRETGLSGEEATALKTLLDSKLEGATRATRDKLLNLLLKNKPTPVQKTMVEKLREKINLGLYSDDVSVAVQDAIKAKHGLPTLSNDEVKFIVDTMDSVKGLPERGEKYLEAMAKVEKLILEKTPASLSQKVASGAFMSMLGNITSPIKNVAGNTLLAIPEIAGNPLARQFDKVVKGISKTNFNTAGKTDFGTLLQGGKQGARSVKRDMLGGRDFKDVYAMIKGKPIKEQSKILSKVMANPIDTDISTMGVADKFETGNRLAFDNKAARIGENIVRTNMKIGDIPFNKAYYEDTLQQLMKVNNVAEATDDMIATAIQVSKERTYKDMNLLSETALKAKNIFRGENGHALKGASNIKEVPQIIMNSLVPFAKTPANIVKRGLEYSPAGLVEGIGKLALNKNKMTMMKQREIVDRLTRGTIGTGLMGAGYLASKSGLITGARDKAYNTERFKKESGILPDALKVGGKTIDLKGLQPITTPLIAGSRLNQNGVAGSIGGITSGMAGALEQYTDMPMLQGIENISTLISANSQPYEKEKALANLVTALPKQYTPSVIKKLAYAIDPFERDLGKGYIDGIIGKLPGVSKLYPAKVDLYGEPVKSYGGKNSLPNTLLNPFLSKDVSKNPLSNEALRLNKSNVEGDLKSGVIPKEVSKDLGNIQLTTEQQNQYQKLMGDKLKARLEPILSNTEYGQLNDNDKAIVFSGALDKAREDAKTEMQKILGINKYDNKGQQMIESANKKVLKGKFGIF